MKKRIAPSQGDRKYLLGVSFFIFGLFSLLIIQFFKIQIVQGEYWEKIALRQHEFYVSEPFKRGSFFSSTSAKSEHPESMQPLTIDVPKFHLHIDPLSIPSKNRQDIFNTLTQFLDISEDERQDIKKEFEYHSRNRKVAMWIDRELKEMILSWWRPFARKNKIASNALFFVNDYQRSYPFGKFLGQILHTIRETKDSTTKQGIPTGGLELYFNDLLKGESGKRRLLRSPRHSLETGDVILQPKHGANIYLTINPYLQSLAEEEIEKGVIHAQAKSGWALMMDPYNGEILAYAQYPFFFPSEYQRFFNQESLIEHTRAKFVTDAYEPASTMKPLTLAICLKANKELEAQGASPLFTPEEKIACDRGDFPGRSKPLQDGRIHQFLNMSMALQKSSNIYIGKLIQRLMDRMGPDWYRNTLQETFAFGQPTSIETPSENPGHVPTPGKQFPNGSLEWSVPTPYSLGIGHNIQVNGVQMIRAFSSLANGGYLVTPTLVRKIIKNDKDQAEEVLLDNTDPKRVQDFPKVLDSKIVEDVVKSMKYVTKWGGTAPKGDVPGYSEAGKTGTAKKVIHGTYSNQHYFSTFVGFAPVSQPRFILLVAIDEPKAIFIPGKGKNHHGGQCAAPIFQKIAKGSLEYLGLPPDDPTGYPNGDPRRDLTTADWLKESKELKHTYDTWNTTKKE